MSLGVFLALLVLAAAVWYATVFLVSYRKRAALLDRREFTDWPSTLPPGSVIEVGGEAWCMVRGIGWVNPGGHVRDFAMMDALVIGHAQPALVLHHELLPGWPAPPVPTERG